MPSTVWLPIASKSKALLDRPPFRRLLHTRESVACRSAFIPLALHQAAVYVIAGGRPILDHARAPELMKKRLLVLDHIEMRLQQQSYLSNYAPGEAEAHRERVRQTRALYEGLLNCGDADAGAIGCFFRAMRE